jgi:hypothetical protein
MAVGMAVTEGADVGAIYSLYVAAFVIYQIWTTGASPLKSLAGGFARLALVVVCAAFLAAQSIHGLIDTSIRGIKGTDQDVQTKAQRWDWATQWSLPKQEMVNLVIPGIFGYRMDDLNERAYWGIMGRSPAMARYIENGRQGNRPKGFLRYSGGGNYAGGFVVLLALWAAAESLRRRNSAFNPVERKWMWFWLAALVVSLLLALGRFAPFYKFVYALPYFSTIRNPTKFIYPFSLALAVLFAFGVHGLSRQYMQPAGAGARWGGLGSWWRRAAKFEKGWVYGCGLVGLGILVGWWQYAAHRPALVQYLQGAEIGGSPEAVADFSISHAGWLAAVFFPGAGLMVLIFSGAFARRRAAGAVCLGLLLVGDLALADYPWVHVWNYADKYSGNSVLDILSDKPYAHRVAVAPLDQSRDFAPFYKLYKLEWMQHEFPYNNVQSFETVEMSRMPKDYAAWTAAINKTNGPGSWFRLMRAWQLMDVGYVFAPVGLGDYLSGLNYFPEPPFKLVTGIKLQRKPGVTVATRPDEVTVVPADDGPFALFRFAPALPRAALFSNWQINTNGTNAMLQLMDPSFDPRKAVLVEGDVPASSADAANAAAGTVEIVNYNSKDMVLNAEAKAPSILFTSDHYQSDWTVLVDGRPATLLRCDFLLRGVQLAPGTHRVEFKFQPSTGWLGISVAAVATTLVVLGLLTVRLRKGRAVAPVPAASVPGPSAPAKPEPAKPGPAKPDRRADARKKPGANRLAKR